MDTVVAGRPPNTKNNGYTRNGWWLNSTLSSTASITARLFITDLSRFATKISKQKMNKNEWYHWYVNSNHSSLCFSPKGPWRTMIHQIRSRFKPRAPIRVLIACGRWLRYIFWSMVSILVIVITITSLQTFEWIHIPRIEWIQYFPFFAHFPREIVSVQSIENDSLRLGHCSMK